MINWSRFDEVIREARKIAQHKNALYGSDNLVLFDGLAILVRMNDKIARLNSLLMNTKELTDIQKEESIYDTLLDLINYSVYLFLLKDNSLLL